VGTPLFAEPGGFDRDALAARLSALAAETVFVGGSSWKYEGWLGQVYTRERYLTRGKFSRKLFEAECLCEYAETFHTVCGDFAFYQFPSPEFWAGLFARTPGGFRFAFKAPELITCKVFPRLPRYGAQGGKANEAYLDSQAFTELFLRPLMPYRDKAALVIFEFGHVWPGAGAAQGERPAAPLDAFLSRLDPFLASLPQEFRYAVEIRNPDFLAPEYFNCLRGRNVAHVYNAWARMPELSEQLVMPGSATADFGVCRALLRRGRNYETAVDTFAPYAEIKDPNPRARDAMRVMIGRARENKQALFLFVNNRLEGNAPLTMLSVVGE
jgi:uncharacterized protein YecE (DUF72 family)